MTPEQKQKLFYFFAENNVLHTMQMKNMQEVEAILQPQWTSQRPELTNDCMLLCAWNPGFGFEMSFDVYRHESKILIDTNGDKWPLSELPNYDYYLLLPLLTEPKAT